MVLYSPVWIKVMILSIVSYCRWTSHNSWILCKVVLGNCKSIKMHFEVQHVKCCNQPIHPPTHSPLKVTRTADRINVLYMWWKSGRFKKGQLSPILNFEWLSNVWKRLELCLQKNHGNSRDWAIRERGLACVCVCVRVRIGPFHPPVISIALNSACLWYRDSETLMKAEPIN